MARPPEQVINAAIADAGRWEWLCYAAVVVVLLLGGAGLVVGLARDNNWTTGVGALVESLVLPLLAFANRVRREKMRLRMYELALSKAKTATEMADILAVVFDERRKS